MKTGSRIRFFFDRSFGGKWWKQLVILAALLALLIVLLWIVALIFKAPGVGAGDYLHKILGYFFDTDSFHNDIQNVEITFPPFISLLLASLGMILLGGMLISVIVNIWERKVERIRSGEVAYHFTGHYVVLGVNTMTPSVVRQIHAKDPNAYIVLQSGKNAEDVRQWLKVALSHRQMKALTFMHGSIDAEEDLRKLCFRDARRVIILGDDDSPSHDSLNLECVKHIVHILGRGAGQEAGQGDRLHCDVLLNNRTTFSILQKVETDPEWLAAIYLNPFNFHEAWAQKVIVDNRATSDGIEIEYTPLDYAGIDYESSKRVHLVVIGMNSMGFAVGVEAARTLHFPNFIRDGKLKTTITFIDPAADREMNYFVSRYRSLFEVADLKYTDATGDYPQEREVTEYKSTNLDHCGFLDVQFSFVKGHPESPSVRTLLSEWAIDTDSLMTVAVCNDDSSKALAAGIYLPDVLFLNKIPVLIEQPLTNSLFTSMMPCDNKYGNIRLFGMLDEGFSLDSIEQNETWALRVQNTYDTFYDLRQNESNAGNAFQKTFEAPFPSKEAMRETWSVTPTALRWANTYNANSIPIKTRSFRLNTTRTLSESDMELMAEVEHNRWNVEHLLSGFRVTTSEENGRICVDKGIKNKLKKSEHRAHFDIRPYRDLEHDANGVMANEYDIVLSKCFMKIINE